MPRSLLAPLLLLCLLVPTAAPAQNPFLENQGRRTIRSIEFTGQERTKTYVLERELGFAVGDDYDAGEVNDAWARLEQLAFIAYVEIETGRPEPGVVDLIIRVDEEPIFRWEIGLDYSTRLDKSWYGGVRLGTVNALGRGDELQLELNAWALRQARLNWKNPWILGATRLGVYADVGILQHDWVYSPAPDAELTEVAGELGLSRDFVPGFEVSLAGRWRRNELDGIPGGADRGAIGPNIPADATSVDVGETAVLASVGFDNRDSGFYPQRGIDASVDFAYGAMGSGFENWSTIDVSMAAFVPVPWLHTLGGFVTRRFAPDPLPWYERTYFGGAEDLRGLPFASRRGDERLRATLEVRRPIFVVPLRAGRSIGLGVHAFSDWGTAWEQDRTLSDQKLANSVGAGVHFNFNTFNYRFEWARHEGEDFFVFEDHFTF